MACWKPLTRAEIGSFRGYGLGEHSIADFLDDEDQGLVRRWRAWFTAPMRRVKEKLIQFCLNLPQPLPRIRGRGSSGNWPAGDTGPG